MSWNSSTKMWVKRPWSSRRTSALSRTRLRVRRSRSRKSRLPARELERLVVVDGGEQLLLEQRGQVGVGSPREVLERFEEHLVRREDLLAGGAAAVVPVVALARPPELPAPREVHERRLQPVVVAGGQGLAHPDVLADAPGQPRVARRGHPRGWRRSGADRERRARARPGGRWSAPARTPPCATARESRASRQASSRRAEGAPPGRPRRGWRGGGGRGAGPREDPRAGSRSSGRRRAGRAPRPRAPSSPRSADRPAPPPAARGAGRCRSRGWC